jgi:Predicted periplasmic ligand-binding sensor domain
MHHPLIALIALLSLLILPSSALYIEAPDYDSGIASAGVKEAINGRYGDVIFATDSGISVYTANSTWYSVNPRYPGETAYGLLAPLDTMVTAIALDAEGHLWVGYPNGLQIGDGAGYREIQDQQFLKNRNINCMVRWGDEMWIATGRAGLHRCHGDDWTWYKPLGPEGLGCYTVVNMVVDAASDALVIGSESNGIRVLRNRTGEVRFEEVTCRGDPLRGIAGVRVDPFGGVYLFNRTTVLRYTPDAGVTPVLGAGDLSTFPVVINDIAATPTGMLFIASDNGVYGWNSSGVALHITSGDGLRSNIVKRLFVDADGRCWFVVPGNVGYIRRWRDPPPSISPPSPCRHRRSPGLSPAVPRLRRRRPGSLPGCWKRCGHLSRRGSGRRSPDERGLEHRAGRDLPPAISMP